MHRCTVAHFSNSRHRDLAKIIRAFHRAPLTTHDERCFSPYESLNIVLNLHTLRCFNIIVVLLFVGWVTLKVVEMFRRYFQGVLVRDDARVSARLVELHTHKNMRNAR